MLALAWGLPASGALNLYIQQVLMYVGINIILTLTLNLVNGYMGEFSVGHAGFMAIGGLRCLFTHGGGASPGLGPLFFPRFWCAAGWPRPWRR